jgi:predicted TIM-barrel fold metal-dependent hydrolase
LSARPANGAERIARPAVSRLPGFNALIDLVRNGNAYVKISGAYRASSQPPDYADVKPLAQALIAANPERILWGLIGRIPTARRRRARR